MLFTRALITLETLIKFHPPNPRRGVSVKLSIGSSLSDDGGQIVNFFTKDRRCHVIKILGSDWRI